MPLTFSKYSACGNDFILIDDRTEHFPLANKTLIQQLCHRRFGIGADGLILLQASSCADARMRIFNSDSSEAEMCGNGIRCLGRFLQHLGGYPSQVRIETKERLLSLHCREEMISVLMGAIRDVRWNIAVGPYCLHHLNTGVPHVVHFVDDLAEIDVVDIGRKLRHSAEFYPHGTNVNFAQVGENSISYRTYERGVEDETLACGTGALAVAAAAATLYRTPTPISIITRSRETLVATFGEGLANPEISGPAQRVFTGSIPL